MMVFLTLMFATLIDPIRAVLSLIGAALSRSWGRVVIAALAVTILIEVGLHLFLTGRVFNFTFFLVSLIASFIWAAVGFIARAWWASRSQTA